MKKNLLVILGTILLLLSINLNAKTVYATVDGEEITQDDIDLVMRVLPGANFDTFSNEQKSQIVSQAIERKLLAKEALKEKVDQDPEYKKTLEKIKKDLALEFWMKKKFESVVVSDKEIKEFYNKNKAKFEKKAQVKARHILLKSEDEAKEVIKELKNAKDKLKKFIELAKEKSTGPSGKSGGDLGWFDKTQMVPEFSDAAFKLKKGAFTKTPVKTQFGYHVIMVEDKKRSSTAPLDEVKNMIKENLKMEKFQKEMKAFSKKLKEKAKIDIKQF